MYAFLSIPTLKRPTLSIYIFYMKSLQAYRIT